MFVREYVRAVYTPLSVPLAGIVDWFSQRRGGYALAAMTPLPHLKNKKAPVFFIQAPGDRWTTVADTQIFFDGTPGEEKIWWMEGITRRFDTCSCMGESLSGSSPSPKGTFPADRIHATGVEWMESI